MEKLTPPILLFDSDCTLCTRFKMALERLDTAKKIQYIPVGTAAVYEQFPEIDREESKEVLHFIDSDGSIYKGGEISAALASQFPAVGKFAWLLETEVGKKVSNYFYDKVNELRRSNIVHRHCPDCHKR